MGRIASINDVNEAPLGVGISFSELHKSTLRKNLDFDHTCFGDVPINKGLKDEIIIDDSKMAVMDLPYVKDSHGRIIPDFKMLARIEEADEEIMR